MVAAEPGSNLQLWRLGSGRPHSVTRDHSSASSSTPLSLATTATEPEPSAGSYVNGVTSYYNSGALSLLWAGVPRHPLRSVTMRKRPASRGLLCSVKRHRSIPHHSNSYGSAFCAGNDRQYRPGQLARCCPCALRSYGSHPCSPVASLPPAAGEQQMGHVPKRDPRSPQVLPNSTTNPNIFAQMLKLRAALAAVNTMDHARQRRRCHQPTRSRSDR